MKKLRFISPLLAVVLALGMFSCDNEEGVDPALDDDALIAAIETATNRVEVDPATLPASTTEVLETEFSESIISSAAMVPDVGFEVTLMREQGTRVGEVAVVFFSINGRELRSVRRFLTRRNRRQARDCFDFVFPLSLTVPDGSSIALDGPEDWADVRAWYQDNPEADERPTFNFPLDIAFGDSTVTVNNLEELNAARASCEVDRADGKCFEFTFPISFTMPDDSEISLSSSSDWILIRQWYRANPDAEGRADLVYPVEITFKDGSTATINSEEEMTRARESCRG